LLDKKETFLNLHVLPVLGITGGKRWNLTFAEDTTEQPWTHGNTLQLFENSETSFS
jgi:hypothetical protein